MSLTIVRIRPTGLGAGFTDTDNTIYLQRRGCANTLLWSGSGFYVEYLVGDSKKHCSVLKIGARGEALQIFDRLYTRDDVIDQLLVALREYHQAFAVSPITIAAAFGRPLYDYEKADLFLSPVLFDRVAGTIIDVLSGVPIVRFANETGLECEINAALAAPELSTQHARGFSSWIHPHDIARGDDYVRGRIAWLSGAYAIEAAQEPIACAFLQWDMQTPALPANQKPSSLPL